MCFGPTGLREGQGKLREGQGKWQQLIRTLEIPNV